MQSGTGTRPRRRRSTGPAPARPSWRPSAHTEAYSLLHDARTAGAGLDCDWDLLTPEQRAWYSMGAAETLSDVLDALPDSVIEHHPGGLKSLQAARRWWIHER